MFLIKKLSQRYSPLEDRLQFAIQNDSSEVVSLWLTQRVALKLAKALVDNSAALSTDFSEPSKLSTKAKQLQSENVNKGSDNKADISKKEMVGNKKKLLSQSQEKPVLFDSAKEFGLVHSLNFSLKANKADLIFRWGVTGSASISLDLEQLKNFSNGLYKLFSIANWTQKSFLTPINESQDKANPSLDEFDEVFESIHTSKSIH